jgi:chemotaxis protein MotB
MAKHKHEEHENHERWLVSYADFITLLFAFFVVMYSVSAVNEGKFRVVSESIKAALHPVVSTPVAPLPIKMGDGKPVQVSPQAFERIQVLRRVVKVVGKFNMAEAKLIQKADGLGGDGLLITIAEQTLFESGRAELKAEGLPLLEELALVLTSMGEDVTGIRVEGHTDNVPIHTAQYPSNWELSAIRATMVARVLGELYGVPIKKLSAAAYAEQRPIADNLTPETRARKRRVELVVLTKEPLQ